MKATKWAGLPYWDNAARVAKARKADARTEADRAYWERVAQHAVRMMTGGRAGA
jgi:hypothetical protein